MGLRQVKAKEKGAELAQPKEVACGGEFTAGGKETWPAETSSRQAARRSASKWCLRAHSAPRARAMEVTKGTLADCKPIIRNSHMGCFESSQIAKGTVEIAECFAEVAEKDGVTTTIGEGLRGAVASLAWPTRLRASP